ncbi:sigma-54-dependent Fis family transcriptional regulator [Intestinimonas butyriciproducens]|uniref:sigma-54-dependent Fis family transcriptional regulator n=1 Tax=Intestinimonas butyriciproducens TaxID=1297617 RepID=UPI00051AD582|nr:sigma-54-dependent Fis family transcriptional regulator [Intestinimonas butyriciproducens]MDB7817069.1 sigma 54-interacting transcriptional regulator [Intestinimonas butyriciproducens]MDB7843611.1 sigma 54-interacting transcriptional regulator [Intestinimonas butyriciproducens]MDB7858091.1 sigma 54-interacting transcriptional regulator [Intestinimonas butyriciproducens]
MTERHPKICLISPTEDLARRAKKLVARRGMDVRVEVAELEAAVSLARRLLAEDDYLFISRRGTRDLLRKSLKIQVVNIPGEASDYIPAIQQLRGEQGLIAFFSFEEDISNELRTICYLLHLKMKHYCFSDSLSCQAAVQQAVADGAAWGLGGVVSERFAKHCDLAYLRVESSDASILHALDTAQQLYITQQENARQQEQLQIQLERYQNILDYTHDAIIAIDEKGRISTTNQIAEQMLQPAQPPFVGRPVEEVLPNTHMTNVLHTGEAEIGQMMNIHGTLVSTNRVPIRVGGQVKGVVATFQDIKTLQTAERNIRIKLHEKGLVAKYRFSDILGRSPAILDAKRLSENFADAQFTVMLYGETGTGKEMFAQSIHNASPRRDGPFVAINCTALNRNLLESELFGYADSSFTGARRGGKAGLFETAHGGTVFLDEIGELPLEFQAPLLRVLQEKEVRRVGDDTVIPVDIRIIGATNRNLLQLVEEGKFRRDLYYRLNVLSVLVPPLRERGDDYLEIARCIYERVLPQHTEEEETVFLRVLDRCRSYAWPGNVRELTNLVERVSLLLHRGSREEEVVQLLNVQWQETPPAAPLVPGSAPALLDREAVQEALRRNGGNLSRTAKTLGVSRSTLYRRLHSGG